MLLELSSTNSRLALNVAEEVELCGSQRQWEGQLKKKKKHKSRTNNNKNKNENKWSL